MWVGLGLTGWVGLGPTGQVGSGLVGSGLEGSDLVGSVKLGPTVFGRVGSCRVWSCQVKSAAFKPQRKKILEKLQFMAQTHTHTTTDIATYRMNRPRGPVKRNIIIESQRE